MIQTKQYIFGYQELSNITVSQVGPHVGPTLCADQSGILSNQTRGEASLDPVDTVSYAPCRNRHKPSVTGCGLDGQPCLCAHDSLQAFVPVGSVGGCPVLVHWEQTDGQELWDS